MNAMNSIALVAPESTEAVPVSRRRRVARKVCRATERGLAILGLILLIYFAGFDLHMMTSGSMSPTLKGNGKPGSDWVLSERITHWFRTPHRWELIAFRNAEGLQIMKRVVGLPGEKVVLKKDGTFLINGTVIERPAAIAETIFCLGNACG
jgi:signal peptidase I